MSEALSELLARAGDAAIRDGADAVHPRHLLTGILVGEHGVGERLAALHPDGALRARLTGLRARNGTAPAAGRPHLLVHRSAFAILDAAFGHGGATSADSRRRLANAALLGFLATEPGRLAVGEMGLDEDVVRRVANEPDAVV